MARVVLYFCVFVWISDDLASAPVSVNASVIITDDSRYRMHQSSQFPAQYPHSYDARADAGARPGKGRDGVKLTPYLSLPMFQHASAPLVDPALFRPVAEGRRVPAVLSKLLFPPHGSEALDDVSTARNNRGVEVWCGHDKVSVRVDRYRLGFRCQPSLLVLGTCPVSRITPQFLYFHYDLDGCGGSRTTQEGQLVYSNSLWYSPQRQGLVIRAMPLNLPIHCLYNRFHYSYKVGYRPQVVERTLLKSVKSKRIFSLIACNAQWEELGPEDSFVLGEPVFFQASAMVLSNQERLYVDSCFVTPSADPNATPRLDVIHNYGCMSDSRREGSLSRFYSREGSFLRFSIDAFLFPSVDVEHLFLHCTMTVASSAPKAGAKSCTFSAAEGRWTELEAPPPVCSCCDSKCEVVELWPTSMTPAVRSLVSSSSWTLLGSPSGGGDGGRRGGPGGRTVSVQAEEGGRGGGGDGRRRAEEEKEEEAEVVKYKALNVPARKDWVKEEEVKAGVSAREEEEKAGHKEAGHKKEEEPKKQESRGNDTEEEVRLGARRSEEEVVVKKRVAGGKRSGQVTATASLVHPPEGAWSKGAEVRSGNRTEAGSSAVTMTTIVSLETPPRANASDGEKSEREPRGKTAVEPESVASAQTAVVEPENLPAVELENVPTAQTAVEPENVASAQTAVEPENVPTAQTAVEPENVPTAQTAVEPENVPAAQTAVEPENVPAAQTTAVEPENVPAAQMAVVEPENVPSAQTAVEPENVPSAQTAVEPENVPTAQTTAVEPENVPAAQTAVEPENVPAAQTAVEPENVPAAQTAVEPQNVPAAQTAAVEPENTPAAQTVVELEGEAVGVIEGVASSGRLGALRVVPSVRGGASVGGGASEGADVDVELLEAEVLVFLEGSQEPAEWREDPKP